MRKPAKAAPRRTWPLRRVRGSIPASPPNESALGYLANENASRSPLLFPVILITGISDVNDINDLAISARSCNTQTLHLVVCTPQTARRDASGPAVRQTRHGGWSEGIPRFFGPLALTEGAIPSFSIPCVQIAIVCVQIFTFTKSIVWSKHYMFYL